MKITGKSVIRIRHTNGVVTKAYIVSTESDRLTVKLATGYTYQVQREADSNGIYTVIG
jgi:hypothetical protein